MKNLIKSGIGFLITLATFSAQAQMADRLSDHSVMATGDPRDAMTITREMTNRLHLNEGQFLKLLPLNRTKLAGLSVINHQYKNDEATRTTKVAELEAQYEDECRRILTPSQLSQLQQRKEQPATNPASTGNGVG